MIKIYSKHLKTAWQIIAIIKIVIFPWHFEYNILYYSIQKPFSGRAKAQNSTKAEGVSETGHLLLYITDDICAIFIPHKGDERNV